MFTDTYIDRKVRYNVGPLADLASNLEGPTNAFHPLAHALQS